MGSIRLAWKLMLIAFFTAILVFSMSPVSLAQEPMTYYLKADDYTLPADGVSSTMLRFCLLDPGGYPTFYFSCSNDDCISLGRYGDIDIISTVQENTEVLARYTAPKIEPTAQLSDIVVPVAIELEYVSPEGYFPTKTMRIWMNLEIGEYVAPTQSPTPDPWEVKLDHSQPLKVTFGCAYSVTRQAILLEGDEAYPGEVLTTAPGHLGVMLEYPKSCRPYNKLFIDKGAEICVEKLKVKQPKNEFSYIESTIRVIKGMIRAIFSPAPPGSNSIYVTGGCAGDHGTQVQVDVTPESDTITVVEGAMSFTPNKTPEKEIIVNAGYSLTVSESGTSMRQLTENELSALQKEFEAMSGVITDFNDGKAQNWIDEGVLGNWAVSDGVYVMTGSHSPSLVHTTCWSYYDREFCDFSYQVDVRKIAGDPSDWLEYYGLLIRSDGTWGNAYMFETRVDGDYLIGKIVEGKFTNLVDWTSSDALKPGYKQWNTLKVVAQGSILKFYANDILLTTVEDTSFSCGKVGLFAGASGDSDSPDAVQFDNVIIIPSTEGARTDVGASRCETNQPPSVSINTVTPTSGPAPLTVSVEATAFDPDGGIVEWRWDFGADGIVDVVERVEEVHPGENRFWFEKATFTAPPGVFITSIVTVEDNCGATASAEFVITIEG